MKLKLLKGHPNRLKKGFTEEDLDEVYRALALTVVPPSEWWVPLRYEADTFRGKKIPKGEGYNFFRASPQEFSEAWDRLEAQVGLCLSGHEYPAAAWYAMKMLGVSPWMSRIMWEDTPYNSRMWVRTGAGDVVLPIPRQSAIESALYLWWALSGGFLNYEGDMLKLCKYGLEFFPHYRRKDEDDIRAHPSRTAYRPDQWRKQGEARLGVLWRGGVPIGYASGVKDDEHGEDHRDDRWFDWCSPDMTHCQYGLTWLGQQRHRLHISLLTAAKDHRKGMYPRAIAAGKVPRTS